ncbi:MAG: hypothetical protein U1A78_18220 [Polyangia bacterium]
MEAKTLFRSVSRVRSALRFTLSLALAAAIVPLPGCAPDAEGTDQTPPGEMPGQPPDPTGMMKPPVDDPDAIRLTLGTVMLRPGEERTVCVTRRLSLPAAVNIVKIATRQQHSHHVIIYRHTSGTPTLNDTPKGCTPLNLLSGGSIKVPLFIGESADDSQNQIQLPPNVAYHVEASDYYTIEAHLLNAAPTLASASAEVILTPTRQTAGLQYADMLFFNNTRGLTKNYDGKASGLPPGQKTTVDPVFSTVNEQLKVFGLATHQHRFGTGIAVSQSSGAADPGTHLFTNTDWSHPPLFRLPDDKPLLFQKGQGLRWVCSYDNTSSAYVKFGQSADTDEMCIIWGYYYPSIGLQLYWN